MNKDKVISVSKAEEIVRAYLCSYTCKKNPKIGKLRDGILSELASKSTVQQRVITTCPHYAGERATNEGDIPECNHPDLLDWPSKQ